MAKFLVGLLFGVLAGLYFAFSFPDFVAGIFKAAGILPIP